MWLAIPVSVSVRVCLVIPVSSVIVTMLYFGVVAVLVKAGNMALMFIYSLGQYIVFESVERCF